MAAYCRSYGSNLRLEEAEFDALPNLLTLRDVVSTIWWMGCRIAAGAGDGQFGRVARARQQRIRGGWSTAENWETAPRVS
jgi:hypothetical protein